MKMKQLIRINKIIRIKMKWEKLHQDNQKASIKVAIIVENKEYMEIRNKKTVKYKLKEWSKGT